MSSFRLEIGALARQSAVYSVSTVVGRFLSLITAPLLTRIFSLSEYGIISIVQVALGMAVVLAGLNLGSGVTYYYYHHDNPDVRRNVLTSGFFVIVSLAFVVAVVLFHSAGSVNYLLNIRQYEGQEVDVASFLKIGSLGVFFGIVQTSMQNILRIKQQPKKYVAVELVSLLTTFALTIFLVVVEKTGLNGVFWATVGGSFCGMMVAIYFCRYSFSRVISISLLGSILAYALPSVPGVLINWVQSQTSRVFINYYSGLAEQGLYSIALMIGGVILFVGVAFRLAYDPYSLSIMKREDAKHTYAKVYSFYAFLFGVLLALISSFSKPILMIITPTEYHGANTMVIWLLAAGFLMGANNLLSVGVWITRRTEFTSYAQLVTFFAVVISSFLLVPLLGALGAAIAYFLGALAQSVAYFKFGQRLYQIRYAYREVHIMLLLLIIVGCITGQAVSDMNLLNSILVALPSFAISACIAFYIPLNASSRAAAWHFLRDHIANR